MILTPEHQQTITEAIAAAPREPVVLPAWAYGPDGRVVVLVDGLPIDLHRHLHNLLIRPLRHGEKMWDLSGVKGNVNPHLFGVRLRGTPATVCPNGHDYEGNEAPPNARRYRCLTCLRDSQRLARGEVSAAKTHCPHDHEYTAENTLIGKDGKRRCRTCRRDQNRQYMRHLRSLRKGTS